MNGCDLRIREHQKRKKGIREGNTRKGNKVVKWCEEESTVERWSD
jgi:hypothetical protein